MYHMCLFFSLLSPFSLSPSLILSPSLLVFAIHIIVLISIKPNAHRCHSWQNCSTLLTTESFYPKIIHIYQWQCDCFNTINYIGVGNKFCVKRQFVPRSFAFVLPSLPNTSLSTNWFHLKEQRGHWIRVTRTI